MPDPSERILFIPEVIAWGGAERSFLTLCEWLYEHGLPHRLLVYWDTVGLEKFARFPLNKTTLNPQRSARHKVAALWKYFHSGPRTQFAPLMSGYQPALHATFAGVPSFHCFMHDTESLFADWNQKKSLLTRLRRAANRRVLHHGLSRGVTIVSSEFLRHDTQRLYGVDPVIARIGTAPGNFRLRPVGTTLRMLSVSRVEQNKRIDWMLEALHALEQQPEPLSRTVDWRLDIAGTGAELQSLKAMSQRLGLAGHVHFLGFVTDEELRDLYERANLFLMPARQGYGMPALEALHRGIPVVLHRESGVSDLLLDTPWAVVFTGGAKELVAALSKMIRSLLAGEPLRASFPEIPTEAEWAEQVARFCKWLPDQAVMG
jgi:glycosyltransferase involved in cell wall biosynthesis